MPRKLAPEQTRVLREALRRREPIAISAISLLEIAVSSGGSPARRDFVPAEIFHVLDSNPGVEIIPFSIEIAAEVSALGPSLRDPSDRAIVSTARVHGLRLITSDQRIIDSGLVPVVV